MDGESLDNHVDDLECVSDRIGIERVARHLIEARILDSYACCRTRQYANAVTGAKRGAHRFKPENRSRRQ